MYEGGTISPICTGRSLGRVEPIRGGVGTETTDDRDIGRSPTTLFERSMLSRFVPARPNDESSGGGGVSLPSRSGITLKVVSTVTPDGERGRFAPNRPRSADTATEGGRLRGGDAERIDGAGDIVPAFEDDGVW